MIETILILVGMLAVWAIFFVLSYKQANAETQRLLEKYGSMDKIPEHLKYPPFGW